MDFLRKTRQHTLGFLAAGLLGPSLLSGQTTLTVYDAGSDGSDFSASSVATGLTAGDLDVGASITGFTTKSEESKFWYQGIGWTQLDVSADLLSSFHFKLTVDTGYAFELTGMSFNYKVGGSGPKNVNVLVDVSSDGSHAVFGSPQNTNADGNNDLLRASETWSHTGASIAVTAGDSATVYIIGYNAHNADKVALIDDITVFGNLTAVPEPSSFAMLAGLGAIGFAATRRRRRA